MLFFPSVNVKEDWSHRSHLPIYAAIAYVIGLFIYSYYTLDIDYWKFINVASLCLLGSLSMITLLTSILREEQATDDDGLVDRIDEAGKAGSESAISDKAVRQIVDIIITILVLILTFVIIHKVMPSGDMIYYMGSIILIFIIYLVKPFIKPGSSDPTERKFYSNIFWFVDFPSVIALFIALISAVLMELEVVSLPGGNISEYQEIFSSGVTSYNNVITFFVVSFVINKSDYYKIPLEIEKS